MVSKIEKKVGRKVIYKFCAENLLIISTKVAKNGQKQPFWLFCIQFRGRMIKGF